MWQDVLKIKPYEMAVAEEFASEDMKEGHEKKLLDFATNLTNFINKKRGNPLKGNSIYNSMSENQRTYYDGEIDRLRSTTMKGDIESALGIKKNILDMLRLGAYSIPPSIKDE